MALRGFIASMFVGTDYNSEWWLDPNNPGPPSVYATIDNIKAISNGTSFGCALGDDVLYCAVNNVAKVLTKIFRDSLYTGRSAARVCALDELSAKVGRTHVVINHVRIAWVWMTLLACVWAMAAIL